jgi:hypothetical protein
MVTAMSSIGFHCIRSVFGIIDIHLLWSNVFRRQVTGSTEAI